MLVSDHVHHRIIAARHTTACVFIRQTLARRRSGQGRTVVLANCAVHRARVAPIIITTDSGFNDVSTIRGEPPNIIWLRIGNSTT
jgi:hypothetical protein